MQPLEVLAAPRRQRILQLIWEEELPVGAIHAANGDITLPAVSQQLAKLRDAGFVRCRVAGRHRFYRARQEAFGPLREGLEALWGGKLDALKALAEAEGRRVRQEAGS